MTSTAGGSTYLGAFGDGIFVNGTYGYYNATVVSSGILTAGAASAGLSSVVPTYPMLIRTGPATGAQTTATIPGVVVANRPFFVDVFPRDTNGNLVAADDFSSGIYDSTKSATEPFITMAFYNYSSGSSSTPALVPGYP